MNLSERLNQAYRQTLTRALCHACAMAAEHVAPLGMREDTARSLLSAYIDVAERDLCPPFSLDESEGSESGVCSISAPTDTRVLTGFESCSGRPRLAD
jgi:hypothetical protein